MSTLGEKIRILLSNQEMTQKDLADKLVVATTTVQKWVVGKNTPSIDMVKAICEVLYIPVENMLDDNFDVLEYYDLDRYLPYEMGKMPEELRDQKHTIIDAGLARGAILHRFLNAGGEKCSAIYLHKKEVWWHYREMEARMISDWNKEYAE